jgi:anti-sigma-K factor RskA
MAESEDDDLIAAERALGTEPRDGETAEQRRRRRPWDALLAPLALLAPPAEPPADMFERITRSLDGSAESAKIIQLAERRARRWRAVALAASGIAACLLVVVATVISTFPLIEGQVATPAAPSGNYIALVTPEGGSGPALVVEVTFFGDDQRNGTVTLQALQLEKPEGRDLELWRVPATGLPVSLGLIDDDDRSIRHGIEVELGDTLAVSVEPPGGSPSGAPTGPVILSGPLVRTR